VFRAKAGSMTALLCGLLANLAPGQVPTTAPVPAEAGGEFTVNPAGLFDVHLRDVSLSDAMRLLSLRSQRNIIVADGAPTRVTADLYQVTFDEALEALLTPNRYTWTPQGKFVYVVRADERDQATSPTRPLELRLFELNFIPAAEVLPIVTKLLSTQGMVTSTPAPKLEGVAPTPEDFNQALNRGLGGKSRAVGEFIVVRDYAEVVEQVAQVIARLDVRPKQVLVEAVILRARLDESNALGIDFNALAGIDFRSVNSTSVGVTNLTTGDVPSRKLDGPIAGVETNLSANVPEGGLSVGIITNNVAAFIRALEEVVDLTIVANPKVLTVNEQPGRVIVGREDGYLTTTVTETATIQTVDFIETGTQILFRPFIGDDGYIRMDIHPEDSAGGLTPANLPFKDTTELTSNVLVKDGHTLVIGGLFRDNITTRTQQFPWLGDIPGFGLLWRGRLDKSVRDEMIVLITPHIITGDEASAESQRTAAEVERWRVLARRGLMPWGRQRLAQAHYRWALEHYRAGRLDKARWDLEVALWLNPLFVEADRLREQLEQVPTAEPDYSIVHNIVRRLIEQELAGPASDEARHEEE
jgi:type IV pilus assembly protein PilQ